MGATSTRRTPRKSPPARKKSKSPSPSPPKRKSAAKPKKAASRSRSPSAAAAKRSSAAKKSLPAPISILGTTIDGGQINALRAYKYNSVNRSILCNSPLAEVWEWIAAILPMAITPNAVTVVGAACSWSVIYFANKARELADVSDKPDDEICQAFKIGALLVVLYNTLDNVDGKLARRRGMGSPLGQMMDHGCDSMTIGMLMFSFGMVLFLPPTWAVVFAIMGMVQWIGVAWEEHYTHILRMDYVAADESEYGAVAICLFAAVYDYPTIWQGTHTLDMLKTVLPTDGIGGQASNMLDEWIKDDGQLLASFLMVTMVVGLLDCMRHVKKAVAGDQMAGWWSEAMLNAVRDLLPYFFYLLAMLKWATMLPISDKSSASDLSTSDRNTQLLFAIGNSAAFSRMCLELIHDTLTRLPIPMIFIEMALPMLGIYVAAYYPEHNGSYIQYSAPVSFCLFATKIAGIGLCYAQAVAVNLIMPPDYGPDGKAIRKKF